MNDTISLAEAKATLALSDFKRRERLLEIIRGKSGWKLYVFLAIWIILAVYICKDQSNLLVLLLLLLSIIGEAYRHFSRRMNAIIELIGEDNLRKPKTDDQK